MKRTAETTLAIFFSLIIIFHLLVITSVIPSDIVWGSRLSSQDQLILFESISIVLNVVFLIVIFIRMGVLKMNISKKLINGFLWAMMVLFLLNTLGNLASESSFEKLAFTPVTLILSICLLISLLAKKVDG